nr:hypothetical protein [uncultured Actinotalea sp.]
MAQNSDAILLESARVHRARLRAAFLHGDLRHRRTTNDNVKRLIGSVVVAAVACAGCAGWSFFQANAGSLRGGTAPAGAPASAPADPAAAPLTLDAGGDR